MILAAIGVTIILGSLRPAPPILLLGIAGLQMVVWLSGFALALGQAHDAAERAQPEALQGRIE
jgi:hypothetical protein